MGSGHSKLGSGKQESLYELLQVSPDADATSLKRAYRQRALELHPDRNFENEEAATALFAKVQAAYDLLTDPREREWYDQHRKNLRYDTYEGSITSAADVRMAVAEELKPSLDFTKIAAYFEKLKHEEQEAAFEQGIEPPLVVEAPSFGAVSDSWATIKPFYDTWASFSTVKDYAWEDIYPVHAAPDRRTRRKFEQQNKKVRDASRRDFNAAVKQAVILVRQRDPRRPASKPEPKKSDPVAEQRRAEARAAEAKAVRDSYEEQDWQKPALEEPSAAAAASGLEGDLECVACEEVFETEFDLDAHKRTPRHKRAVAALKAQLLAEDEAFSVDDVVSQMDNLRVSNSESAKPADKKEGKAKAKARKKKKSQFTIACGTCGAEFAQGPDLIAHKQRTRHP